MSNEKRAKGIVTAEIRQSDGACVARELFATYPVRFQLTSRPNEEVETKADSKVMDDEKKHDPKALSCYVLGYGGGLVSGDFIDLQFKVKSNASLLITSQSTSKAFKAIPGRPSTFVRTNAFVDNGGLLVLVPQPTQCFAKSNFKQETNVYMQHSNLKTSSDFFQKDSSILLVDWYTGGRENLDNGHWQLDSFRSSTTVSYVANTKEFSSSPILAFHDSTRLSGGFELQRHMRSFNVVCLVVMIGSRVQPIAEYFLKAYSSRHSYFDDDNTNNGNINSIGTMHMNDKKQRPLFSGRNYTHGEGLNGDDGLLVSCGTFPIPSSNPNKQNQGVVLRLAAMSIEQAAFFLSKYIGSMNGQLQNDPFLEIVVSRQSKLHQTYVQNKILLTEKKAANHNMFSFGLAKKSYNPEQVKSETRTKSTPYMTPINLVCTYQLVDSSTPTGGFAHSNTVEVAHQLHFIVHSSNSMSPYTLKLHVWEVCCNTCTSLLPFLVASCRLFHKYQDQSRSEVDINSIIDEWLKLDIRLSATMTSHVARRASAMQGSGMLRAYIQSFPHISVPLKQIKKRVLKASAMTNSKSYDLFGVDGHAATCFGAVCGLLCLNVKDCTSMFLYTSVRDMINAAVRMNLVGPLEAGKLIHVICTQLDEFLGSYSFPQENINDTCHDDNDTSVESAFDLNSSHQIAPIVEILANAHDRLYTRLFNS